MGESQGQCDSKLQNFKGFSVTKPRCGKFVTPTPQAPPKPPTPPTPPPPWLPASQAEHEVQGLLRREELAGWAKLHSQPVTRGLAFGPPNSKLVV